MDRQGETGESSPWSSTMTVNQDEFAYHHNQSFSYRPHTGERERNTSRGERAQESQETQSEESTRPTKTYPPVSQKRELHTDHSSNNDYSSHPYHQQAWRMQYASSAYHSHHVGEGESIEDFQMQHYAGSRYEIPFDKQRQQVKEQGLYTHPGQMNMDYSQHSNAYHVPYESGYAGYYPDPGTNPHWQYGGPGYCFAPPQYPSNTQQSFGEDYEERQDFRSMKPAHRTMVESSVSRTAPLFMVCDGESLSEYQCLLRKQIEIFSATSSDIEMTVQGRNRHIEEGQVGVRCRHCADIPIKKRARGAVYYPSKLSCIYQAAQNLASVHLTKHCTRVPDYIRTELLKKDRKSSAGSGKDYWAVGAHTLGVVEVDGRLWFSEDMTAKHRFGHYCQI